MSLLMRRFLLLISAIILSGCSPALYSDLNNLDSEQNCISKFIPEFTSQWYNTQINIAGKHMSGLLFFKMISDSSTRVVFTSETGVTFFDFDFNNSGLEVVYITPKLNKKVVIATLEEDIGMLLHHLNHSREQIQKSDDTYNYIGFRDRKEVIWYLVKKDCSELVRIEKNTKRKRKIIVNLSTQNNALPDSVYIEHQSFNFNISLNKIHK